MPTLNERENIERMYEGLKDVVDALGIGYEFIFIDDNSQDGTIEILKRLRERDPNVKYVVMSRRFGDQPCLMAGLRASSGDAVVTMDADLQHPPSLIPQMVGKWREGHEIIVMCREEAGHSRFLRKWSEIIYYRILGLLSSETTFYRFAGYALLDRRVVNSLARIETRDPYLRGLIGDVGFSHHEMTYSEDERSSGATKYNLRQLLQLAVTGLTATSTIPLYLPLVLGFVAIGLATIGATLLGLSCVISWPNLPHVLGWAVAMLAIVFLSGVQLLCLGILGIYIGKVVIAGKRGPSYIVAECGGVELE